MGKPEDAVGKLTDAIRRYHAGVLGKYLEDKYDIDTKWRSKTGWKKVIADFNKKCVYCGAKQGDEIEVPVKDKKGNPTGEKKRKKVKFQKEHLESIHRGGIDIKGNVLPACEKCNNEKSDKDWIVYLNGKYEKSEAEKKINRIEEYRKNDCKWDEVKRDSMYITHKKLYGTRVDMAIRSAHRWITNEIYQDVLYEYFYHITPAQQWDRYKNKEYYSPEFEVNGEKGIICSYEFGIAHYLEHPSMNRILNDELIILSIKKDLIKGQYKSFDFENDSFYLVQGQIPVKDIIPSDIFTLEGYNNIKDTLSSMKHTLTAQGKTFPGYDFC